LSPRARFNVRDQAMHQALQWHVGRLPRASKIIVWCATIHAAKSLRGVPGYADFVPLGSYVARDFGDAAAAIGISALGGSYGRGKAPATTLEAPAASLEARAFTGDDSRDVGYLGRGALAPYGPSTAQPLNYSKPMAAPWHEVIDGLLVLREEHPLKVVHDPKPRRDRPTAQ
jgi:erythromycin esterase-like protein